MITFAIILSLIGLYIITAGGSNSLSLKGCCVCGRTDSRYEWTHPDYPGKIFCTKKCLNKYSNKSSISNIPKETNINHAKDKQNKEYGRSVSKLAFSKNNIETINKQPLIFKWVSLPEDDKLLLNLDSEIYKNISSIDLPIRANSDLKQKSENTWVHALHYELRNVRFLISRYDVDIIPSVKINEGRIYSDDYLGYPHAFFKILNDREKEIFNKQHHFVRKYNILRKFDFFTFQLKENVKVDIKKFRTDKDLISKRDEIKNWIKKHSKKDINVDDLDNYMEDQIDRNISDEDFDKPDRYNEFSNQRLLHSYTNQLMLNDKCLVCRNDISDLHHNFYFCLFCIELVDFDKWFEEYSLKTKNNSKDLLNNNIHCLYDKCENDVKEGHFCEHHQLEINKYIKNMDLFKVRETQIDRKEKSSSKTYKNQWKLFNRMALLDFVNNKRFDFDKLQNIISNAPESYYDGDNLLKYCHRMIILIFFLNEQSTQAVEYLYQLLDSESNRKSNANIFHFEASIYSSDYNGDLDKLMWDTIINKKMDIHPILIKQILQSAYYSSPKGNITLEYRKSSIVKRHFDDFIQILTEHFNAKKDTFFEMFIKEHKMIKKSRDIWTTIDFLTDAGYGQIWDSENHLGQFIAWSEKARQDQIEEKDIKKIIKNFSNNNKDKIYIRKDGSYSKKFVQFILDQLDEVEIKLRDKHNIPQKGEKWVSETQLYNLIETAFPKEEIIRHASPKWLGRQHLDIYFPKLNIGIEYQGKQHYEPVDFFGGKEGFEKNKERDERKRKLCKKHKCILIEVSSEEFDKDFLFGAEDIIDNVEDAINKKKAQKK